MGSKNENKEGPSALVGVPESSSTFQVSRSSEKHAQIPSNNNGKPGEEVQARAGSCSPISGVPSSKTKQETTKVISVTDFLYDDLNEPYAPLPEHDLDQSPCYPIIAVKQDYFFGRLHSDAQRLHLESVEHHVKYNDSDKHKLELLNLLSLLIAN
jgi:hypothetical protein